MITTERSELATKLRNAPLPLIASRVRQARVEQGLSHDEVGRRMGGTFRQTLIGWEKIKHRPTLELLVRYAEATGKPAEWFVESDPDPFREAA